MGIEQDKTRKTLDKWALIVVILITTAFGATIIAKNLQYGLIFYLILTFAVIAVRKGWFKNKVFHD